MNTLPPFSLTAVERGRALLVPPRRAPAVFPVML